MTLKIYIESRIRANSESSLGTWSYAVDMSTIIAHLPMILMFQSTYEMLATGLPIHRERDSKVARFSLLSKGA